MTGVDNLQELVRKKKIVYPRRDRPCSAFQVIVLHSAGVPLKRDLIRAVVIVIYTYAVQAVDDA